jgi:hypothetical protein
MVCGDPPIMLILLRPESVLYAICRLSGDQQKSSTPSVPGRGFVVEVFSECTKIIEREVVVLATYATYCPSGETEGYNPDWGRATSN